MSEQTGPTLLDPAENADSVTPHDTNKLSRASRALWIGTGGSLVVTMFNDSDATFENVPDGTLLPIRVTRVKTATTATQILSLS